MAPCKLHVVRACIMHSMRLCAQAQKLEAQACYVAATCRMFTCEVGGVLHKVKQGCILYACILSAVCLPPKLLVQLSSSISCCCRLVSAMQVTRPHANAYKDP